MRGEETNSPWMDQDNRGTGTEEIKANAHLSVCVARWYKDQMDATSFCESLNVHKGEVLDTRKKLSAGLRSALCTFSLTKWR